MLPLHPNLVHFPVALLISAGLFAILANIVKRKKEIFIEVLFWNLALGSGAAIIAVLSGLLEKKSLVHNQAIHEIMELHELLGFILCGVFISLTVWLILRKSAIKTGEFRLFTLILIVGSGLLGFSSHLGGKMVYEHGAGIIPMKEIINNQVHEHEHQNGHESHDQETRDPETHDHDSHDH